jgi:hypothetical protein
MNLLELRYKISIGLTGLLNDPASGFTGTELLGPQNDGTVRMKVFTTDPMAAPRTFEVSIVELCCRRPKGSGSDCSGSLRDACTCMCHYRKTD